MKVFIFFSFKISQIRKFIPSVQTVGVIFENEEELGEVHSNPSGNDNTNYFNIDEEPFKKF